MITSLSDLRPEAATGILLLADHLDAALAHCEDIAGARREQPRLPVGAGRRAVERRGRAMHVFVADLRERELALMARLRQARVRAEEAQGHDARLDLVMKLFLAGTAALADASELVLDEEAAHTASGRDMNAYLRRRGAKALAASSTGEVAPGEAFLVAGYVPLGTLMDLLATVLDKLDLMFDLYSSGDASGLEAPGEPGRSWPSTDAASIRLTPEAG